LNRVELTFAACDHAAMSLAHPRTNSLTRRPFALAVIAVYLVSFISQMLLSAPVTSRLGVAPFALAQIALIWLWIVLHRRRLRDAGRPSGIVFGIAFVYALQVLLLLLLVWMIVASNAGTSETADTGAGLLHLFTVLYLLGMMTGDPALTGLQLWLAGLIALLLIPVLIGLCFSLWAATRPSVTSTPGPHSP
jgi:uncharacterized membrane protein YhaH (DUF805 family)